MEFKFKYQIYLTIIIGGQQRVTIQFKWNPTVIWFKHHKYKKKAVTFCIHFYLYLFCYYYYRKKCVINIRSLSDAALRVMSRGQTCPDEALTCSRWAGVEVLLHVMVQQTVGADSRFLRWDLVPLQERQAGLLMCQLVASVCHLHLRGLSDN